MKKVIKYVVAPIVLAGVVFTGVFNVVEHFDQKQEVAEAQSSPASTEAAKKLEQISKIEGVEKTLTIDEKSTEIEVINVLHKMTHQKVVAEQKWGAIQMKDDHIQEVRKIIANSKFDDKEKLLSIVDSWNENDFSHVDEDHNHLWNYLDGTIGKATGILSPEDELEFIENNFK